MNSNPLFYFISLWIMRIGLALFSWTHYLSSLDNWNFKSVSLYISAIFIIFSSFLVIGGFLRSSVLTRISALMLLLVSGYQAVIIFPVGINTNFSIYIMTGGIALYFLAKGNR